MTTAPRHRLRAALRRLRGYLVAHPFVLVGLLLAALALVLVYPAVLGGRVLGPEDSLLFNAPLASVRPASLLHPSNYLLTDAVEVFHPDLEWARAVVRSGHLPLWNPYIFGGWPEVASQQTAPLYPLTMLVYVLPFWPALGVIAVLKLVIAGLGTWWLGRRLGLGLAAALLAALVYSLGSYFVIWLEHPHTNVYALIPWLLGTIDLVCARRRWRDAGALAALVALCLLGGHPESTFIAMLAALAFGLLCLTRPAAGAERRRATLLLGAGALLGLAGGAVMLAPLAELAGQAPRLARGGGSGIPDDSLLGLLLPDRWGRPDGGFEGAGPSNYAERTAYIGALPLMLAAAGLHRLRGRSQWFFAGLLVGALVLSVNVPWLTGAIDNLPVLDNVNLARALILVALSLALLAGFGLQSLLEAAPGQRRVMLAVAAVVASLPLLWLAGQGPELAAFPHFSDIAPSLTADPSSLAQAGAAAVTRWTVFALAGLVLLAVLAATLRRGRSRAAALALALAVALVAGDLVSLGNDFHPAITQALAEPAPTPSLVRARAHQGAGRVVGYNEYLIPNALSRYGLKDARGHGLPALGRYLALWNALGGAGFQTTRLRPGDRRAGRLLDDFAVNALLTTPTEPPPAAAAAPGLHLVARLRDGAIYQNATALPRAYVATTWRPAGGRRAALSATVASTSAELRAAPVIEGAMPAPGPATAAMAQGTVKFARDAADMVSLGVEAPRRGYLVLLDTYYAGWSATVDGRAAPILAANEAFRAVAVPAGRHRVIFRYRPAALAEAAALSGLAWLAILGLMILPRIRRRRGRRPRRAAGARGPTPSSRAARRRARYAAPSRSRPAGGRSRAG